MWRGKRGRPTLLAASVAAALLLLISGCGNGDGDADDGGSTPDTRIFDDPTVILTPRVDVDGEPWVSVQTLPAAAISADQLEPDDGAGLPLAKTSAVGVQAWERVSPSADGWLVWQPAVVVEAAADAGADAVVVRVEEVDWPDACLGAARPDEACAQVLTPGYRVVVEAGGRTIEYHTGRSAGVRRAS